MFCVRRGEEKKKKTKIKLRIGPHFVQKWKKKEGSIERVLLSRECGVLKTEVGTEIKRGAGTFLTVTTVQRQEEHGAPTLRQREPDKDAPLH